MKIKALKLNKHAIVKLLGVSPNTLYGTPTEFEKNRTRAT
jgi:hypothetical protein